jgi:PAS domain S-box-containing protein
MPAIRQLRSLADLQPGDHLCSFYASEAERRAALRSFISQGLEQGEKILYIHEGSDDENALRDLSELGVGIEDCLEKGGLSLVTEAETCLQDGAFDPGRMIGLLQAETERALAQGYPALRAVGATGWVHRRQPGSDHLIEYEAKLSAFFSKNKCLALCPYDLRKFDPSLLLNVLASHPFVITGAEVYENIYYIPPKELLGENFLEAALRYFLRNLKVQTQAQAERRTIDTVLADLFALASDGIILIDRDQRILAFNRGAERIFGYRSQEVLGQPVDFLMPSRFAEHHRQRVEEHVKAPEITHKMGQQDEIFGRRKDGAEFPVEASVTKLSKNGDLFFTIILRDISQRRQAEAVSREEGKRFEALFNGVPVPTYVWQRQREDFILVIFNRAAYDYSHGRASELLGKTLTELYGDRPEVLEDFSRCFRDRVTIRREFGQTSMITGQWRDFIVHYVPVATDLVLVHTEDVTERKRAEQALRMQGQIIDQIHDAVVSTDLDGYVTSWNKGAERQNGYSAAEILGKHISILYGEDQLDFLQQEVIAPLKAKGEHEIEVVLKNADGQDFDGHLSLSLLRDPSGNPIGMIGYTMDISALKRTQRELQTRACMQAAEAELGQLALAGGDPQALMDQIVSEVAQTLEVEYCKILELQPSGQSLLLKAGVGWRDGAVGRALVDARDNSQVAYTLLSNQPVIVNDLRSETRFTSPPLLSEHGVVSGMSVVIPGTERPYGILGAHTVRQREFSQDDVNFLASVANLLAIAIEHKHAEQALQHRAQQLETMHEIDRALLAAKSLPSIAQSALTGLVRLEPFFGASVVLFDLADDEGIVLYDHNLGAEDLHVGPGVSLKLFGDIDDLRAGRIFQMEDTETISDPDVTIQNLRQRGLRSYISVPLITQGELVGVLNLGSASPGKFPAATVQMACQVADSMALAIQQTRLVKRTQDGSDRLRELSRQVVTAQEDERRRVSRELHDESSQALMALKISLDMLRKALPEESGSLHQRTEEALGLADETMEGIRLLAHDLRPPELDAVGLDPVLEDYCREFGRRTRFDIDYRGDHLPALPDEISIGFYRVLQEALTNILKHAHARHVQVALSRIPGAITLSVADDGQGFDLGIDQSFPGGGGIGLLGMRERVELLGGRLEVQSHPGQGTRVQATVPWEKCA